MNLFSIFVVVLAYSIQILSANPVTNIDKARSCLDANGCGVKRDFTEHSSDCTYANHPDGSFEVSYGLTFTDGDETECPTGDFGKRNASTAQCSSSTLTRQCEDDEVADWFHSVWVVVPEDDWCQVVPDYLQTLTPGTENNTCTCQETFKTPPLVGNCGSLEPDNPEAQGGDGRKGCNDGDCQTITCEWDSWCCGGPFGNETGWWDRFCISYASTQEACLRPTSRAFAVEKWPIIALVPLLSFALI